MTVLTWLLWTDAVGAVLCVGLLVALHHHNRRPPLHLMDEEEQ